MTAMLPCCQGKSAEEISQDIVNNPQDVFARDLLIFLANGSKDLCLPECRQEYEIQPASPLTEDIRLYIDTGFTRQDPFYNFMYQTYKTECDSDDEILASFSRDMLRELREMFSEDLNHNLPLNFVFEKLVRVAKFTIEFYKQGVKGVLPFALRIIAQALVDCNRRENGQIFEVLSKYASDVIRSMDPENVKTYSL